MKSSIYGNYATRSLLRGGQRSILAICCVAVGVMAVVALQMVGFMLQSSFATNVRVLNGGDIAVMAAGAPLREGDLAFFARLQEQGTISNYTALIRTEGRLSATATRSFSIEAVDAANFPLVATPDFVQPAAATVASLLRGNGAIVTQDFLTTYHKQLGATLSVQSKSAVGSGATLTLKIVGVVASSGVFAQASSLLLISTQIYLATAPTSEQGYTQVDVTTPDQAHTAAAVRAINAQFQLASTQTAADVLKAEQSSVDTINKFLEITGLLSLLIGGVGIVNTMQVQLSRRKGEIALLKTTGYRRRDLYLLFGLEAGLLGLCGGLLGSLAAIGISALVRNLMQQLGVVIPFLLNPQILGAGLLIGLVTALIFGLLPIAQAANVRPLSVMRDQETHAGLLTTVLLLVLFSLLFYGLASVILQNDLLLSLWATYGTFACLLLLSAFFSLLVLVVSKLPLPERLNLKQCAFVLPGLALAALLYQVLPAFGLCLLAASLLGLVVVFVPRGWKVTIKLALRNAGRRRARTATTMLALFIGVFGIALVIGVSLDLQTQITASLSGNSPYNLAVSTSGQDTGTLRAHIETIPGLSASSEASLVETRPLAINGQAPGRLLPSGSDRQQASAFLSEIEGYNLARAVPALSIVQGRNLSAGDAHTTHVLISQILTKSSWLHLDLKVGDTITFSSADGTVTRSATIVGVIATQSSFATAGKILGSDELVSALATGSAGRAGIFYLKVDPAQIERARDMLGQVVPAATVQDLSSVATSFTQELKQLYGYAGRHRRAFGDRRAAHHCQRSGPGDARAPTRTGDPQSGGVYQLHHCGGSADREWHRWRSRLVCRHTAGRRRGCTAGQAGVQWQRQPGTDGGPRSGGRLHCPGDAHRHAGGLESCACASPDGAALRVNRCRRAVGI
jgi:predicted lysophospholipase L1 biosynthesis ABC-type transport system permease subunit